MISKVISKVNTNLFKILFFSFVIMVAAGMAGCVGLQDNPNGSSTGGGDDDDDYAYGSRGTGTLNLSLTDAPVDSSDIVGVWVTITGVTFTGGSGGEGGDDHDDDDDDDYGDGDDDDHLIRAVVDDTDGTGVDTDGTGVDTDGDGIVDTNDDGAGGTIAAIDPGPYNLLELTGGNSALLGALTIGAGTYTQIRFMLDVPNVGAAAPATLATYLEFADGTTQPLYAPSAAQTGYKAIGNFTVPTDGVVNVTADFDVRKAIVSTAQGYLLKPTLRLIVESAAGDIAGTITNGSAYPNIVVYAYRSGAYSDTESGVPAGESNRFPNAVTSGNMDASGTYTLSLLSALVSYDLIVAGHDADGAFGEVLGSVTGVTVTAGAVTATNIDTSAL